MKNMILRFRWFLISGCAIRVQGHILTEAEAFVDNVEIYLTDQAPVLSTRNDPINTPLTMWDSVLPIEHPIVSVDDNTIALAGGFVF